MTRQVISAWSAVSPFGIGRRLFAKGVTTGATAVTELDPADWQAPGTHAAPVPSFDIREVLGPKGTRSLDRVSALALGAAGELLESIGQDLPTREDVAVVLGTTAGSVKSMTDMTRDTLTREKPYFIDTPRIPNAIMNSAAAQCAIWHQLKGPNATIAGGRAAGLLSLRYAMRLLSAGRARLVLCGGAEEFTPQRAWLDHHGRGQGSPGVLGEGSALLLVEQSSPADAAGPRAALAEILTVELGVHFGRALAETAAESLRRALARADVTADELWAVSLSGAPDWDDGIRELLAALPGAHEPVWLPGDEAWGDAGATTAAFQIASALAWAEHDPSARGRVVAITSFDRDGAVGCALLRMLGSDQDRGT